MALTNVRKDTLGILNEVQRRLGVRESSRIDDTQFNKMLVDFLNDVIEECSDFSEWQEMYREVAVTAAASVRTYEIAVSSQVKNLYQVHWNNDVSPMEVREIQDIRRLRRTNSNGTPRNYAVVGVSGVNPIIEVHPRPTTAATFNVAYYKKPRLLVAGTADSSATPAFPSRMLVQGVYAKALLEENGGAPGQNFQTAYAEYQRMRREARNRLSADTGSGDIYLVPTGKYGARSR